MLKSTILTLTHMDMHSEIMGAAQPRGQMSDYGCDMGVWTPLWYMYY